MKRVFLLTAAFAMAALDLISRVHICVIYYHATQMVKIFHIPQLFFLDRIDIDEIGKESVEWIHLAQATN